MELLNNKKILIIAPHQDDETIGCGGLIGYALQHGSKVEVVHVFAGSTGIAHLANGTATSSVRAKEAQKTANEAGFVLLENLGFLDRTHPSEYQVQSALINVIRHSQPDIILLPHVNESDIEHAMVSRVGKEATWLASANIETNQTIASIKPVELVLYYSVWTPIHSPRLFLDITKYVDLKRRMLAHYTSQMNATSWDVGSIGSNAFWGTKLQTEGYVEVFDCEPISIGGK